MEWKKSAPYLHLRELSRTTSKKHTEEANRQLDQYEIILNEIRISRSAERNKNGSSIKKNIRHRTTQNGQ
jgi:hypothetical protein